MPRSHFAALFTALSLAVAAPAQGEPPVDLKQVRAEADAAVQAGEFAKAAAGFRKLTEANAQDAQAWHMLGYCLHVDGKLDEALPAHLRATEFKTTAQSASYNVACVHALQGHADDAFTWLDKAIALGFADAELIANDGDLASLRKDERFAKVEQTVRAKARPDAAQGFAQATDRRTSRIIWFDKKGSPGQVALSHTPVAWNDRFDEAIASGKLVGKRWRLGADFWTTLDTSIPLRFGEVEVPAGYYYLTVVQRAADQYVLAVHDAAEVRKQKLDAAWAHQLKGGIEVPLQHGTGELQRTLAIDLSNGGGSSTDGELTIRFGGHSLAAPFTMQLQ